MKMFVYPKFSKLELPGIRFGGFGLGNLLLIWARAKVYSIENNAELIWPTWPSIKVGPWIRNEKDKRFYADLFTNRSNYLDGAPKYRKLLLGKCVLIDKYKPGSNNCDVILYNKYKMEFADLLPHHKEIKDMIENNLQIKGQQANLFSPTNAIGVHIRLGDFAKDNKALEAGKTNKQIPIKWYENIICQIKSYLDENICFKVFSDGTDEELQPVLKLPNVERVTFGNSIADIVALSKFPLLIVSGSTFSMWARFLGKCSAIGFRNQLREKGLCSESGFEEEFGMNDQIDEMTIQKIKKIYK